MKLCRVIDFEPSVKRICDGPFANGIFFAWQSLAEQSKFALYNVVENIDSKELLEKGKLFWSFMPDNNEKADWHEVSDIEKVPINKLVEVEEWYDKFDCLARAYWYEVPQIVQFYWMPTNGLVIARSMGLLVD